MRKYTAIQLNGSYGRLNAELHCETCNVCLDSTNNDNLSEATDKLYERNRKDYYNHNSRWECHDCFSQERFNEDFDNYIDPLGVYH